jgi:hypothetical protein
VISAAPSLERHRCPDPAALDTTRLVTELVEAFLVRPYSFDAYQAWLDFGG